MTEFREAWAETIRHVHAILAETETVRYTRIDGTVIRVESVHVGLTVPLGKVQHVEVYGTAEDGGHTGDRFLADAHEVPDEIARLMSAVIKTDEEPRAPASAPEHAR